MLHQPEVEVLVVGAGPVGMLTALLLSQAGITVRIIDRESRTASRTYACALHPRTLQLTDRLALTEEILARGRVVSTVAFYEGAARRADVRLSELPGPRPYVVVLPQGAFEDLLEERLRKLARVQVQWNHQLSGIRVEGQGAVATVDRLAVSAKGYIVPEMDWEIEKTKEVHCRYIVGADGPNSFVAHAMGLGHAQTGASEFFAVFEFQSNWNCSDELRIVVEKGLKSVLWPLPGDRFRWSFQLREEHMADFPSKERQTVLVGQAALEESDRQFVKRLVKARAPWFTGSVGELGWSTDVEFQQRLAHRFGLGPCWLAGDAAHQTGPEGMHSMNVGLLEGERLAEALRKVLRGEGTAELLENYNQVCREEWSRLLAIQDLPGLCPATSSWVKEHRAEILECLPSSGEDLKRLLAQVKLAAN